MLASYGVGLGWLSTLASYGYDASGGLIFLLLAGDLAHGVVKGQAEHAHEEVNGVAGQITLWPRQ